MLVVSAHADSVECGGSGVAQESYMGAATRRDGDDRERRVQAADEAPSRLICRSSIAGEASLSGRGADAAQQRRTTFQAKSSRSRALTCTARALTEQRSRAGLGERRRRKRRGEGGEEEAQLVSGCGRRIGARAPGTTLLSRAPLQSRAS